MKSYKPEELFDNRGHLIPELQELAPSGERRMGANPSVNGGRVLTALDLPEFSEYALECQGRGKWWPKRHGNWAPFSGMSSS